MRAKGYWFVWENLEKEIKDVISQLGGRFPTTVELSNIVKGRVLISVKLFGGIHEVAKRMGYQASSSDVIRDYTEEKIINILQEIINKLGRFPKQVDLRNLGMGKIDHAIYRQGKNLQYYAKKLGFTPKEKPKGYWNSLNNLLNEIRPYVKDGKMPTTEFLSHNIGSNIKRTIAYHGGIAEIAKKLGCTLSRGFIATDGHHVNSANELFVDEFLFSRGIKHDVGGIISEGSDREFRYDFKLNGDFFVEIWGYEPGRDENKICVAYNEKRKLKEEFYNKNNFKLISIESSMFKHKLENVEQQLSDIFSKHGFDVSLKENVKFDIKNYTKYCYYWNHERIVEELSDFINASESKKFPTRNELVSAGRGDLSDALKRHGGYIYFQEVFKKKINK